MGSEPPPEFIHITPLMTSGRGQNMGTAGPNSLIIWIFCHMAISATLYGHAVQTVDKMEL